MIISLALVALFVDVFHDAPYWAATGFVFDIDTTPCAFRSVAPRRARMICAHSSSLRHAVRSTLLFLGNVSPSWRSDELYCLDEGKRVTTVNFDEEKDAVRCMGNSKVTMRQQAICPRKATVKHGGCSKNNDEKNVNAASQFAKRRSCFSASKVKDLFSDRFLLVLLDDRDDLAVHGKVITGEDEYRLEMLAGFGK